MNVKVIFWILDKINIDILKKWSLLYFILCVDRKFPQDIELYIHAFDNKKDTTSYFS